MVIASFVCHGTPGYWAVRVLARLRFPALIPTVQLRSERPAED
jgi:hypothetical protein